MTYEERIAAAQAKMEAFKAKMAEVAEKTKAAHAMKKEEINAAIDAINADLDDLDAAIAEDVVAIDAAVNANLDELDAAVAESMDDLAATAEGNVAAAKENIRLAKERKDSKLYAIKLKAQMRSEALKAKIAEKRAARDKEAMEVYILDLLDYAESCEQLAFAWAIEADITLLEAAAAAAEYIDKYGEAPAEIDEEAAEE